MKCASAGAYEAWGDEDQMRCRCAWLGLRWKQVRACDDNGGGQTDEYVTLPPPPGRCVPRRNRNTGEGGCAVVTGAPDPPWRLPQCPCPASAFRAGLGLRWPRQIGSLGRPWHIFSRWPGQVREFRGLGPRPGHADKGYMPPPPKKIIGEVPL